MHSSRELQSSSFEITVGDRDVRLGELFQGFGERDRLGVVIRRPCGGVGASALITATITAFYDLHRARGPDFFIYPDYFLFHVGRRGADPRGDRRSRDHAARSRGWRARRADVPARSACERSRTGRNMPGVFSVRPRSRCRRAHRKQSGERGLRRCGSGSGSTSGQAARKQWRRPDSRRSHRGPPGRGHARGANTHEARPEGSRRGRCTRRDI
jgi:hypothetical protein